MTDVLSRICHAASVALVATSTLACSDSSYTTVTVRSRPTVVGATSLTVQLKNGAGLAGDTFELDGRTFPVTFTVSSPGRTGDLEIEVSARDRDNLLVGRGATTVPIDSDATAVLLESADFVVNTNVATDQYLTNDFESVGSQLAAMPSGKWVVAFREQCTAAACNVFSRRFQPDGQPLASTLAAGTNAFAINTSRVGALTSPTVATGTEKTLVLWETVDTANATDGVACRALDVNGAATVERRLVTELTTDVVVAAPLPSGAFAVTWSGRTMATDRLALRTAIVGDDCLVRGAIQPVATVALPTAGLRPSAIVAGRDAYVVVWPTEGGVRARGFTQQGVPTAAAETQLLSPEVGEQYSMVRVAAHDNGFALAAVHSANNVHSLRMFRFTASATQAPTLVGQTVIVADKISSPFDGFAIAAHPQGPIMVTWESCGDTGDGEGCGVLGRWYTVEGVALGEAFPVPTTTSRDQTNPSIAPLLDAAGARMFAVAWNDASAAAPDTSGLAVRARLVYFAPER